MGKFIKDLFNSVERRAAGEAPSVTYYIETRADGIKVLYARRGTMGNSKPVPVAEKRKDGSIVEFR